MLFYHQKSSVPIGIEAAPYWGKLFLCLFQSKYAQQLISKRSSWAYKFHGISRFIDEPSTINDGGDFSSSYKYIYHKQLELKLERQGDHATFLDLNLTVEDNIFVYKLFDK